MRKESDEVYFERIAQEVLDSERIVLNNLELFSNICVRPAIEQAIIKQNSSLHKLFLLWELLRDLCQQYCTDLSKEPFHKTLFGHIVVDNLDFFRAFARYSLLYEEAFVYLKKKISKSSGFRAFIENVESRPELQRSNVTNYMIIPVSRIARYNLLLREMKKYCPTSHLESINNAINALMTITDYIHNITTQNQNRQLLMELYKTLKNKKNLQIISDNRCLLVELQLASITLFNKREVDCKFYLFNDLLLIVKKNKLKYHSPLHQDGQQLVKIEGSFLKCKDDLLFDFEENEVSNIATINLRVALQDKKNK